MATSYTIPAPPLATDSRTHSVFSDDFNRADASLGNGWTQAVGAWTVTSNQARLTTTSGVNVALAPVLMQDGYGSIQYKVGTTQANHAGLIFRYVDASNYWRLYASVSFGGWTLEKKVAGTATVIVGPAGATGSNATGVTVRIVLTPTTVAFYKTDGLTLVGTYSDSSLGTAELCGITGSASNPNYEDFVAVGTGSGTLGYSALDLRQFAAATSDFPDGTNDARDPDWPARMSNVRSTYTGPNTGITAWKGHYWVSDRRSDGLFSVYNPANVRLDIPALTNKTKYRKSNLYLCVYDGAVGTTTKSKAEWRIVSGTEASAMALADDPDISTLDPQPIAYGKIASIEVRRGDNVKISPVGVGRMRPQGVAGATIGLSGYQRNSVSKTISSLSYWGTTLDPGVAFDITGLYVYRIRWHATVWNPDDTDPHDATLELRPATGSTIITRAPRQTVEPHGYRELIMERIVTGEYVDSVGGVPFRLYNPTGFDWKLSKYGGHHLTVENLGTRDYVQGANPTMSDVLGI